MPAMAIDRVMARNARYTGHTANTWSWLAFY